MGLKTDRTQITIASLEFGGVLANTVCSNTTEAKSRQYSLHAPTPLKAVVLRTSINSPNRFRALKLNS